MNSEKHTFFTSLAAQGLALTFDDVRLRTSRSHVSAPKVDITSRFSRNIDLKVPMVSAAMDTVTTAEMAIAMAKLGGLGIIHAGLSVEEQCREVRRVKLSLNGLIENPVSVEKSQSLASVLATCAEKRFDFRTFPVLDKQGRLVGLLTQNDFDFASEETELVSQVMTPLAQVLKASPGTTVAEAYQIMKKSKKKTLPLLTEEGKVTGLYVFSDVKRIAQGNAGQYNVDKKGRLRVGAAVPTDSEALERVRAMREYLDVAVVDTAQGDSDYALETLKELKKEFPDLDVVVGNISEGSSARELAEAGADGIKVGQGPGSICTTRIETGIGCPQVTAVYECAQVAAEYGIPICADGGIKEAGDISIALAAGAHCVMLGSKLAGTRETPGEIVVLEDGARVKVYRGMGSPSAMKDSAASRKRYGVSGAGKPLAEGIESYVPYRGSVVEVMDHYTKALRKSMAYVGASDIETHRQNTRFWRITNAGMRESHPHDVRPVVK